MTRTDTLAAYIDAITAETERMNHSIDRNADGTWPAVTAADETKRYANIGAMITLDMMIGALHRQLFGYVARNGDKKPGLHGRASEQEAKIADLLDRHERSGSESMTDATYSALVNMEARAECMADTIKAAQTLKHELVGAWLDAAAGTETEWKPYDQREKAPEKIVATVTEKANAANRARERAAARAAAAA